ncbi:TetR/AcrR family transcriptional regulator [Agromyces sp. NPDC055520]
MSSSLSPRRDARRNHERLLAEAKQLFGERGIDAPLDELAARAGVGAGTVYRHFPNRDALVRELYDDAVADLEDFAPQMLGAETGWRAIELWLELLGGWFATSPHLAAVARRIAELDPSHRPAAQFAPMMDAVIARAQSEGSLRRDVTAVDLGVMVDMLGSLSQYGDAYLPYWRRQLAIMLDGLRARPDLTPLPGEGQTFDEFHDMTHAKLPGASAH